jgi:hypothetical protein
MKKVVFLVFCIVFAAPAQQEQKHSSFIGLQTRINLINSSIYWGDYDESAKYAGMGMGFGGGFAINGKINNFFILGFELNFNYRTLYSINEPELKYKEYLAEFSISCIPLKFQFMPFVKIPLYLAMGLHLDFPFASEISFSSGEGDDVYSNSFKLDNRKDCDLGFAWEMGYHITKNIAINFRAVTGFTSIINRIRDTDSYNQYGIGFAFFLTPQADLPKHR